MEPKTALALLQDPQNKTQDLIVELIQQLTDSERAKFFKTMSTQLPLDLQFIHISSFLFSEKPTFQQLFSEPEMELVTEQATRLLTLTNQEPKIVVKQIALAKGIFNGVKKGFFKYAIVSVPPSFLAEQLLNHRKNIVIMLFYGLIKNARNSKAFNDILTILTKKNESIANIAIGLIKIKNTLPEQYQSISTKNLIHISNLPINKIMEHCNELVAKLKKLVKVSASQDLIKQTHFLFNDQLFLSIDNSNNRSHYFMTPSFLPNKSTPFLPTPLNDKDSRHLDDDDNSSIISDLSLSNAGDLSYETPSTPPSLSQQLLPLSELENVSNNDFMSLAPLNNCNLDAIRFLENRDADLSYTKPINNNVFDFATSPHSFFSCNPAPACSTHSTRFSEENASDMEIEDSQFLQSSTVGFGIFNPITVQPENCLKADDSFTRLNNIVALQLFINDFLQKNASLTTTTELAGHIAFIEREKIYFDRVISSLTNKLYQLTGIVASANRLDIGMHLAYQDNNCHIENVCHEIYQQTSSGPDQAEHCLEVLHYAIARLNFYHDCFNFVKKARESLVADFNNSRSDEVLQLNIARRI